MYKEEEFDLKVTRDDEHVLEGVLQPLSPPVTKEAFRG